MVFSLNLTVHISNITTVEVNIAVEFIFYLFFNTFINYKIRYTSVYMYVCECTSTCAHEMYCVARYGNKLSVIHSALSLLPLKIIYYRSDSSPVKSLRFHTHTHTYTHRYMSDMSIYTTITATFYNYKTYLLN